MSRRSSVRSNFLFWVSEVGGGHTLPRSASYLLKRFVVAAQLLIVSTFADHTVNYARSPYFPTLNTMTVGATAC